MREIERRVTRRFADAWTVGDCGREGFTGTLGFLPFFVRDAAGRVALTDFLRGEGAMVPPSQRVEVTLFLLSLQHLIS